MFILIGVDWKSMVFPACLPITTDYYPDELKLKTYYAIINYTLTPEGENELIQPRTVYRGPLSVLEAFYQIVSQRLAQVSNCSEFIKISIVKHRVQLFFLL